MKKRLIMDIQNNYKQTGKKTNKYEITQSNYE